MIEIKCIDCKNCTGDSCKVYGSDADKAVKSCADDSFRNYKARMTREEAIKWQETFRKTYGIMPEAAEACDMAIKALQEPERKRGRWIKLSEPDENDNIKCRCSECHAEDVHSKSAIVPFCWKCGADMRGEHG